MTNFVTFRKACSYPERTFRFFKNLRGKKGMRTDFGQVEGTCCWKICDDRRLECETLTPGENKELKVKYAATATASEC